MRNSLRDPRYRAIVTRLVQIRDETSISQRDLAAALGQSRSYVSKAETFERRLDFVQLVEWLRALGADEKKFLIDMLDEIPSRKRKR